MASETAAQSRFLTLDQVGERFQLSRRTIERLVATEILPSVRIGGSRRVSVDKLDEWINQRTTVGGSFAKASGRSSVGAGASPPFRPRTPAAHVRDPDPAGSRSRTQRAGDEAA
jgi:excisionase family DNA binding protein